MKTYWNPNGRAPPLRTLILIELRLDPRNSMSNKFWIDGNCLVQALTLKTTEFNSLC